MNRIAFLKVGPLALVISVLWVGAPRADASVLTTGCATATQCTLQELFDGGSITVGRLVFSEFAFVNGERIPGSPPEASQMIVSGLEDGGVAGNGLGYDFANELSLASGGMQAMTFRFTFQVSDLLSQAVLTGHTLKMAAFINAGNPGAIEGQLNVRDAVETPGAIGLGNAFVESVISDSAGVNILNNPDQVVFMPQSAILVSTAVNATTVDQIELGVLEQRFSTSVPELETLGMFACGLAMLLAVRWTRRHV